MPGMPRFNLPALLAATFDHFLGPTKPVEGTVRDKATGKGLAKVGISGNSEGSWWEDYVRTETDANGHYRLVGLPVAPSYRMTVYAPNEMGYLPGGKPLAGSEGLKPLALDFELVRGVRVKGRITDKETGKPVHAALWYTPLADNKFFKDLPGSDWFRMVSQSHVTEKDGSYSLLVLPGTGVIKVRAEPPEKNPYVQVALDPADYKRAYSTKTEGMGQSFLSAAGHIEHLFGHNAYRVIDPDARTAAYTCNFELDKGRTLKGEVLDPDGKPLAGATAGGLTPVWGRNVDLKEATFTAQSLNAAQPRPLAFIHKARKLAGWVEVKGDEKALAVRMRPWGAVEGRVLDEEGNPIAGARVSVGYPDNATRWLSEAVVGEATTDAAGKFRLEGLIPGLEFAVGFRKGKNFLDAGETYRNLKAESGKTNNLGDVHTKVYRLP
jgi:protocatechuate 3,4-dioxygenase beta subunit